MRHSTKPAAGFTLAEMLVALAILVIVTGSILVTTIVATGYWKNGNAQNDAKESVRLAMQTLQEELSQAVADPDPGGGSGNPAIPPSGYLSIFPPLALLAPPFNRPTGVILPNANIGARLSVNALIFNEPNPAIYNPFLLTNSPAAYRLIQYSINDGKTLTRTEQDYDPGYDTNGVSAVSAAPVLQVNNGTLQLWASLTNSNNIFLQVTATKNGSTYTLYSSAYFPSGANQ